MLVCQNILVSTIHISPKTKLGQCCSYHRRYDPALVVNRLRCLSWLAVPARRAKTCGLFAESVLQFIIVNVSDLKKQKEKNGIDLQGNSVA
jgi:hypothetical protein